MNRTGGGFSFGAISALTALLVLALACFSMLSRLTAVNDLALSEKTADSVSAYYAADFEAHRLAQQAYDLCLSGDYEALEQNGFEFSGGVVSYFVRINPSSGISVKFALSEGGMECTEWSIVSSQEDQ